MPSFAEASRHNTAIQFSYRPVAIFVGGTSGVGEAMAERFAHHTKGNAHIIICGRNQAAAEKIFSTFPQTSQSKYEFVYCDASLIRNVIQASATLKTRVSAINYLVFSQGTLQGPTETAEGLDVKVSLHFYSRWKFVDELLPLLHKATDQGQEARVMSILSTVSSGKIDLDDLGLKKTNSFFTALRQVPAYNDLFVEEYAKRHPNISFTHIYPGFVKTPLIRASWIMWLLAPIMAVSMESAGEWMLFALWAPENKTGHHHLDNHADPVAPNKSNTDETTQKLVEHYKQAVNV